MSKKLIDGIMEFNLQVRLEYQDLYSELRVQQTPDALFFGCSDSRVLPNILSQSEPGELFVVRNVGNIVPVADKNGISVGDESEASAIEYGLGHLKIDDIIVCGHSSCGAMNALLSGRENIHSPNLKSWLRHADGAFKFKEKLKFPKDLPEVDRLSQANVLLQLEHIKTYPAVKEMMQKSNIRFHAWWFDLSSVKVFCYNPQTSRFEILN
jgi:carbonic anhydrase